MGNQGSERLQSVAEVTQQQQPMSGVDQGQALLFIPVNIYLKMYVLGWDLIKTLCKNHKT